MQEKEPYSETEIERLLIDAIYAKAVTPEFLENLLEDKRCLQGKKLITDFHNVCQSITEYCRREKAALVQKLALNHIEVKKESKDKKDLKTYHALGIQIHSKDLYQVVQILSSEGYFPWKPLAKGELELIKITGNKITLVKTDHFSIRVSIHWRKRKRRFKKVSAFFRPAPKDLQFLVLPRYLWFLYGFIRPFRKVFHHYDGPDEVYLGTSLNLVSPLLDVANISEEDSLVDLGCGDGRIVNYAVKKFGCQGLGIESNPFLFAKAVSDAREMDLERKVEFMNDDFEKVSFPHATVVFVFLPVKALNPLIPKVLEQLPKGSRIVSHEQSPINVNPKPNKSRLIATNSGITVAHLWEA